MYGVHDALITRIKSGQMVESEFFSFFFLFSVIIIIINLENGIKSISIQEPGPITMTDDPELDPGDRAMRNPVPVALPGTMFSFSFFFSPSPVGAKKRINKKGKKKRTCRGLYCITVC